MKTRFIALVFVFFIAQLYSAPDAFAGEKTLTLEEAFRSAEKVNPALEAAQSRIVAAESSVGIAKSGYLPTVEFEAIDSWGFAGSSGLTGIGGLMGSPYRSGSAYGIVARETLWDFGRTSISVEAAENTLQYQKVNKKIALLKLKEAVLNTFYDCSRFRTLREAWGEIANETQIAAKEISRFVKTGQRTLVEKYLVDAQSEEALTSQSTYDERLKVAMRRLALITGISEVGILCPMISEQNICRVFQPMGTILTLPWPIRAQDWPNFKLRGHGRNTFQLLSLLAVPATWTNPASLKNKITLPPSASYFHFLMD